VAELTDDKHTQYLGVEIKYARTILGELSLLSNELITQIA
jgi:hypothetical protein